MTLTLRTARETRVMTLTGNPAVMTTMINLNQPPLPPTLFPLPAPPPKRCKPWQQTKSRLLKGTCVTRLFWVRVRFS